LGGADKDAFTIDASTGVVSMAAKDYENPDDVNTDNVYNITIIATDDAGNSATKSLNVIINNVEDSAVAQSNINPIADYRFDECIWNGTAGEVIDQTGNYNATAKGATLTEGKLNNGAEFTGSDYVELPTINGGFSEGITIMAWVDFGTFENFERIVELSDGSKGSNVGNYISLHTEQGKLRFQSKVGGANAASGPLVDIPATGMHYYVATYDHTTGKAKIYIDSILKQTVDWDSSKFASDAVMDHNYIGKTIWSDIEKIQYDFKGKMDEVKIVNRALSAEEISTVYTNENSGKNYNGTEREEVDCSNP